MQPTLLLLAAGMGSRYGGLKQLEPMGPDGQTIMDYAVRDALQAGFGKVVFVIREAFAEDFRRQVGGAYEEQIEVRYAFQDIDDLPAGFHCPEGRSKPWGTAHAVRAARGVIDEPFAVINADDFYGASAYARMSAHLQALPRDAAVHSAMVGYTLEKTLSPHGTVNRGICQTEAGQLRRVEEFREIGVDADGSLRGCGPEGQRVDLPPSAIVSMNFWGFSPNLMDALEQGFRSFLEQHGDALTSEYYLPSLVDTLIREQRTQCPVLETDSQWFGVTYPEDKARVMASLRELG
jgi:NDP-sugar pyrophosphorylase family protein